MPGFTLIYQQNGLTESIKNRANRLVEASFKVDYISKSDQLIILFKDGNHYPYEIVKTRQYIIIVEGKIYDIDHVNNKEFLEHIDKLYLSANPENDLSYFHQLDGEFNIFILDKKGQNHFFINDFLGRLPAYVYQGQQFILSRDIFVLDKITTGLMFDEQSVYQFLRMGYPLGDRTLFNDIKRFPAAGILTINESNINIKSSPPDLSAMEASDSSKNPEGELYELFKEALKNRLEKEKKVVLSLSGGLDSRLIMGEIINTKYPVDYASFEYENAIIKNDIAVVKQLAKLYDRSPQYYTLKEWAPELIDEMATLKGGMNYVGMSFILDFLKQLGAMYGMMLTGDGGDKTLPGLFPNTRMSNKNIANAIIKLNSLNTSRFLDEFVISECDTYEAELRSYLNNIPGKNAKLKYKHFLVYERALNWLFEGEDRNRNYIWSTSPFYSPAFFNLVHRIPEDKKRNFELFRKFIDLVDPKLNTINNANWGIPLGDQRKVDQMLWRQKIKNRIPFKLRAKVQKSDMQEQLVWYVSEMLHKGYGGQVLINADQSDLKYASSDTLFHLLTILKVSEMTWKSH